MYRRSMQLVGIIRHHKQTRSVHIRSLHIYIKQQHQAEIFINGGHAWVTRRILSPSSSFIHHQQSQHQCKKRLWPQSMMTVGRTFSSGTQEASSDDTGKKDSKEIRRKVTAARKSISVGVQRMRIILFILRRHAWTG